MRWLCVALLLLPAPVGAGLLDLLPLARIERKMIYPLSPQEVDPGALRLTNTAVHSLDRGGVRLIVWTMRADDPTGPTVLYFHGNAGNLATRSLRFAALQDQGINVIAMSYRGSSGSGGQPSEAAILSDAQAVFQQVDRFIDGLRPQDLVLYGESLGAAVAVGLMASLDSAERPAGAVLEAPFTSVPDMARAMAEVPDNLIARIQDRWNSLGRANTLTTPLLVVHGTADEVTPFAMGRTLFEQAATRDKTFVAAEGASHATTWRPDTMPQLWAFIHTHGAPQR